MQSNDDDRARLAPPARRYAEPPNRGASLPVIDVTAVPVPPPRFVPPQIAGMLLPSEAAVFESSPHPFVIARPIVFLLTVLVLVALALSWHIRPIINGHHVDLPLLDARMRIAALAIGGGMLLRGLALLVGGITYYLGFRVITTNRRVFCITGILSRRVSPIGNTALAGSSIRQGVFGQMLGFGTIGFSNSSIRDIRNPVRLYREFQAVANGVDGDTWTPAIRQTRIP